MCLESFIYLFLSQNEKNTSFPVAETKILGVSLLV